MKRPKLSKVQRMTSRATLPTAPAAQTELSRPEPDSEPVLALLAEHALRDQARRVMEVLSISQTLGRSAIDQPSTIRPNPRPTPPSSMPFGGSQAS